MNQYDTAYSRAPAGSMDMAVDAGLRSFMLGVYNKMALGLLLSAVIAFAVGTIAPISQTVLTAPVLYIVQWGPLVLLLGSNFLMRNPSPAASSVLYWSIVTLMGAGLGVWVYMAASGAGATTVGGRGLSVTFETMALAFAITASSFMALSFFGYTTKRNLTGIYSFAIMAIWGVLAISLLNFFFFKSGMLELVIQFGALALFAALMASQTQMLKGSYYAYQGDQRSLAVMTNMGALNLYIAFVQMFQILLSLLSSRD